MSRELTTSDREMAQKIARQHDKIGDTLTDNPTGLLAHYLERYEATVVKLLEDLEKVEIDGLPEVSRLLAENVRLHKIEQQVLDEEKRQREWEAFCRESDVRCMRCDLRYAEREDYGCQIEGRAHRYDEEELAEARKVEDA